MSNVINTIAAPPTLFLVLGIVVLGTTFITIHRTGRTWHKTRTVEAGLVFISQCLVFVMTIIALLVSRFVERSGTAWAIALVQGTVGVVVTSEASIARAFPFATLTQRRSYKLTRY